MLCAPAFDEEGRGGVENDGLGEAVESVPPDIEGAAGIEGDLPKENHFLPVETTDAVELGRFVVAG